MRRYHSRLAIIAALALGCDDGERRAEPTAAESQQQGGTSDGLVVVEDAAGGFHRLTLGPDTRFAGEQGRRPAPGDAVRIEYLVQGEQRLARRLEVLQPPAGH